jgi:DNA-binding PadR family transcriptional regulator
MARDNKTIYAILGLLNHEDLTGYDIKKRIDISLSLFWNIGFGQIYPTLKVLVKDELVIKKEEVNDSRKKIVYSITDKGREELKKWLLIPVEKEYVKYEILLKLFFGSAMSPDNNIKLIEEFQDRNKNGLDTLKLFKKELSKILDQDDAHVYYYLTVLFGEKIYNAYMEWSEEAIKLLKDLGK